MEEADLEVDVWIERVVWALSYNTSTYSVSNPFQLKQQKEE